MLRRTEIKDRRSKCSVCGASGEELLHCKIEKCIDLNKTSRVMFNGDLSESVICKSCGFVIEFIDSSHLEKWGEDNA